MIILLINFIFRVIIKKNKTFYLLLSKEESIIIRNGYSGVVPEKKVVFKAKVLTTKEDLTMNIANCFNYMEKHYKKYFLFFP